MTFLAQIEERLWNNSSGLSEFPILKEILYLSLVRLSLPADTTALMAKQFPEAFHVLMLLGASLSFFEDDALPFLLPNSMT
jgi:hypothetical protein